MDEDVEGERRRLPHVPGAATREPGKAGSVLELVLELSKSDPLLAKQVHKGTGVDRSGACRHRHPLERRESHRRVDRPSFPDRCHGAASAEMADDEPLGVDLRGDPLDGDPMEAVAVHVPFLPPSLRDRVGRGRRRHRAVESGIEHRDVRDVRQRLARTVDLLERPTVVERSERNDEPCSPAEETCDRTSRCWS